MDTQKYLNYLQQNFSGCKNCGSKKLAGTGEEIFGVISLTMKEDGWANVELNKPMPMMPAVCGDCGFVHFFSKVVIDKKIS